MLLVIISLFVLCSLSPSSTLTVSSCETAAQEESPPTHSLQTQSHRTGVPFTISEATPSSQGGHPKKLFGSSKKKRGFALDSELSPLMPSAVFSPVSTASSASFDQSSSGGGVESRTEAAHQTQQTNNMTCHSETQV